MPRMPVALVSATLLVLLAASPAAAHGKPDRVVFTEPDVFQIDGACEFSVGGADDFARVQILTFSEDAAGTVRVNIEQIFRGTLTNADTGASIPYVLAGRGAFQFLADGRATISGKGTSLVWYGAADAAASQLGQGIFLVNGTTSERYDAEGNLVAASARGRIVDVCAALS